MRGKMGFMPQIADAFTSEDRRVRSQLIVAEQPHGPVDRFCIREDQDESQVDDRRKPIITAAREAAAV